MVNKLDRLPEFVELLGNYQPSAASKKILQQTNLVLLGGPSSSGRNTIVRELLKTGHYRYIISDTTREMRFKDDKPIEQNGREYWFRSEDEVLEDLRTGKFIEAALIHGQQISGISIREVEKAHHAHQIAITDVTPAGVHTIHALKPDTKVIFVVLPNFAEWMHRFDGRGVMPLEEKRRRLESAVKEFEVALSHDYYTFVVNDNLARATAYIDKYVRLGRKPPDHNTAARLIAKQLLADTRQALA